MFIAIDGDAVGKKLQQYILSGDLSGLRVFSDSIKHDMIVFSSIIEKEKGTVYMVGGDNIFAQGDANCARIILKQIEQVNVAEGKDRVQYSLAIGDSTQDAYIGLNYAKGCKHRYIKVNRNKGNSLTFDYL